METLSQKYVDQVVSCLMRSLPKDWRSFVFTCEYGDYTVLQYGTVKTEKSVENIHITQECNCDKDIMDIDMSIYLSKYEETGIKLAKMVMSAKKGEDISVELSY